MNASGMAALYLAFLACRPGGSLIQLSVVLSLIGEAFYQLLVLPPEMGLYHRLLTIGGGTGIVGLVLTIYLYFQAAPGPARDRCRAYFIAGLCLLFYPMVAGKGIGLLSNSSILVVDSHVYRMEGALGFFPAQAVASFLVKNPKVHFVTLAVYSRLPLFVFLGIYLASRYPKKCYPNVLIAFIMTGVIAFPLYFVLPMVGIDLFVGIPPWPMGELPILDSFEKVQAPLSYPRTCLPSLHTAWILLFYFAVSRISRRWAYFSLFVVVSTLISALGPLVGHYSIDLFVGVPYCVGIVAISTQLTPRNRRYRNLCLGFGFGATLFWVLLFRFAPGITLILPAASWGVLILTCIIAFYLEHKFCQKSLEPSD